MFELNRHGKLQYLVHYPDHMEDRAHRPVIFYLHGSGSRGTDCMRLRSIDYFALTRRYEAFPFITVVPQCHEDSWMDLWESTLDLFDWVANSDFCDASRLCATGVSMGGYAAWQLGMSRPRQLAALVPICGGGVEWNAPRLRSTPIWAFHGQLDHTVPVDESRRMVDAVNQAGGNARLTVYPDVHHEAWCRAYADPALFEWMLTCRRGR